MSDKTRSETQLEHGSPDRTASWSSRAILGATIGLAVGFLPLGAVILFVLYIFFYDCGYSTNCPSGAFASWYVIAGFISSAMAGGLIGGKLHYRSTHTVQAAFRGGRSGAVIGEVLFVLAYIVMLILVTR